MNWSQFKRGLIRRIYRTRPFRLVTIAQLAAHDPACWQPIYPEGSHTWPEQLPSGPLPAGLSQRLSRKIRPRGVLRIKNATVLSDNGWVFTEGGQLVTDTCFMADRPAWIPRVYPPLLHTGARILHGRTLSLLSNSGSANFFHMQMDVIPRIDLLFQAGWNWRDFDQILLPNNLTPSIRIQLEKLAMPLEKCLLIDRGPLNYFRITELVCTSFPNARRCVLPTTTAYLQQLNARPPVVPTRRLFVQRRSRARHLRNEAELLPLLIAQGFEIFDPGDQTDPGKFFHEASHIVATHGAALANLLYCQPGTKVLELIPSDQLYPYYFTTAISSGLHYDCLTGPSDQEKIRHVEALWNSPSDFVVDSNAFSRCLCQLLSS
jgi:hypothetical protein